MLDLRFRPAREDRLVLGKWQEAVDRRLDSGEQLAQIEAEVVDTAPLDEERRAALWLYAWHRTEASEAVRVVRDDL
jgi:hypothetical protein